MENPLNKIDRNWLTISFKLLYDFLFICLLFFLLALIAEGALPGIVTAHVGFSKLIFIIFLIIIASYILADYLKINVSSGMNKKTAGFLLFILILLVFNSLLKLNILLNILILLGILAAGYFIYKSISE